MRSSMENRKIFLVASSNENKVQTLSGYIKKHISGATIYTAGDGLMAQAKIDNVPPHVLVISFQRK